MKKKSSRSTQDWIITPHERVGPIFFGMTRPQVRKFVGGEVKEDKLVDRFEDLALSVYYKADDETCACVEISGVNHGPTLKGRGFLGRPYDRALAWFQEIDPAATNDESSLRSAKFGVGLKAMSSEESSDPPVASISAFIRGYTG